MTTHTPPVQRQPLAQIDVRSPQTARQLGRILPATPGASRTTATFNSAL